MKTFVIIFGFISFSFGLNAQTSKSFLCGNGKFEIDLHEITLKADSLVKIGKLNEAIVILLPFALDTKFGENSASTYSARLIKKIYAQQDIEKELKKALESIKVKKQIGPYGEIQTLQMVIFGNDIALPDSYYWLGAPPNKPMVSREKIDSNVAITKSRRKIDSSLLYSALRS